MRNLGIKVTTLYLLVETLFPGHLFAAFIAAWFKWISRSPSYTRGPP